jgi:biopolymer transport protein ExbB/TolQ
VTLLIAAAGAAPDYSFYGMFLQADPIVKGVMIGLALASVACWAIIFEKMIRLAWLRGQVRRLDTIAKSGTVSGNARGLVGKILASGEEELNDGSSRSEDRNEVRARVERSLRMTLKSELQRQEAGLPFLATIGSAAPFIGLFGTVWGIMNSFTAIGMQQDTSLATVAPGIAEALLATALGLAAAIPAVMAYNAVSVSLGRLAARAGTSLVTIAKTMTRPTSETVVPMRAGKGI